MSTTISEGLTPQDVRQELHKSNGFYAKREDWAGLGAGTGVVSAVALYFLASGYTVYKLNNSIKEFHACGKIRKLNPNMRCSHLDLDLWWAAALIGPALAYPMGATFLAMGSCLLFGGACEMALEPVKQLEQEIQRRPERDKTLSPQDTGRLVALLDREAIHHLMSKMNEAQLRAACQVLNHSTIKGD